MLSLSALLTRVIHQILPGDLPEDIQVFILQISKIVILTLIMLIIKYLINNILNDRMIQKFGKNHSFSISRARTINSIMRIFLLYTLYIVYGFMLLEILGAPIRTLIAGAGIAGVAIGLGAQDLINSMINGFFILLENQMEIGDLVQINTEMIGTVQNLGIRTTTIRNAAGDVYYWQNSEIKTVVNKSRSVRQFHIEIPLNDINNFDAIESTIKKTVANITETYANILVDTPVLLGITRGEAQSFNYRITFKVAVGNDYEYQAIFYRQFYKDLQEISISIPSSTFDSE